MINNMIKGYYNAKNFKKDKNKIAYRSIYVLKGEDDKLLGFESTYYGNITNAVSDAVKYLKLKNFVGEYILYFNMSKIIVSSVSNVNELVDNYLKTFRDDIYTVANIED